MSFPDGSVPPEPGQPAPWNDGGRPDGDARGWTPQPVSPGYTGVPHPANPGFVPTGQPVNPGFVPASGPNVPPMFVPTGQWGPGYVPPASPAAVTSRSGVLQLRPQTVGDVLDVAFKVIRGNPGGSLGTPLLGGLLAGLLAATGLVLGLRNTPEGADPDGASFALIMLGGLLSTLVFLPVSSGLVHVFGQAVLGRRASAAAALRAGLRRAPVMLGLMALMGLAVGAGFALIIVIMMLGSNGDPGPAWILLFVPFMVGLLFLGIRLCLAGHVVVLERAGPIRSIARSWALTRGRFWRTLGVMMLAQLVLSVISYVVQMVLSFVMVLVVGFSISSAESGDTSGNDSAWGMIVFAIIMVVLSMLTAAITYPFLTNVLGALYADARIRDEGLGAQLAALQPQDPNNPNVTADALDFPPPGGPVPGGSAAWNAGPGSAQAPFVQRF